MKTLKIIFGLTTVLILTTTAHAAEQTHCYPFTLTNSPAREANPPPRTETWCYEKSDEGLFVYNADADYVKPELAFLVDKGGVMTHASLAAGEISVHRVKTSDFNPFSIPMDEPKNLKSIAVEYAALAPSAEMVKAMFRQYKNAPVANLSVETVSANASANVLPWRGYWFPYSSMHMRSPLAAYDAFVAARTGVNPGALNWENTYHAYHGVNWEGHCNGWAAAAILRPEPTFQRGNFEIADLKGLYTELDYCVSTAFYGNRNYGSGDLRDIYPAPFHKAITYYLGTLHKPVAMDMFATSGVDNNVVSGYSMNMQKTGANSYTVTTTLTIHNYDKSFANVVGVAPSYTKVFRYVLTTDRNGNPVGGYWLSGNNPDFIWVPLSPGRCGSNNQRISASWVNTIENM